MSFLFFCIGFKSCFNQELNTDIWLILILKRCIKLHTHITFLSAFFVTLNFFASFLISHSFNCLLKKDPYNLILGAWNFKPAHFFHEYIKTTVPEEMIQITLTLIHQSAKSVTHYSFCRFRIWFIKTSDTIVQKKKKNWKHITVSFTIKKLFCSSLWSYLQ